jgi:hypothetical protein
MIESFWSIPAVDEFRTPLAILREQANALTEQTGGLLVGSVASRPVAWTGIVPQLGTKKADLAIRLDIQVPALNNYSYGLMTYWQPVELYPGYLEHALDDALAVSDEAEFVEALKGILHSDHTRRVIGSLLSQAKAA